MRNYVFLAMLFAVSYSTAQKPVINSFYPVSAKANDTIQISGQFFSATVDSNAVQFGVVSGKVVAATSTQLRVIVPMSASNAPITVTTRNRSVQSSVYFQPIFPSNYRPLEDRSLSPKKVFLRPMQEITSLVGHTVVTAHDLNGDGKPELISSILDSGRITVLVNASTTGNLAFSDTVVLPSGLSVSDIQVADLNGDNRPDIIVANNNHNTLTILKNQTTGSKISFATPITIAVTVPVVPGVQPRTTLHARITDLNKDGLPDIFVAFSSGSGYYALINNTSGAEISFKSNPISYNLNIFSSLDLQFRDLNEDGESELVVLDGSTYGPTLNVFKVQQKTGDSLSFTKIFTTSLPIYADGFTINYFDNDQKPDIVVACVQPSDIRLFTNTSTVDQISFIMTSRDTTQLGSHFLTSGDLNGDSKNEIVFNSSVTQNGLRVIQHMPGENALKLSTSTLIVNQQEQISLQNKRITDLNFDGRPDMFGLAFKNEGFLLTAIINQHTEFPVIDSFYPMIAGYGDTVTINGFNLSKVTKVHFQDSAALSFTIMSDYQIKAVVGKANPGFVYVSTDKLKDSLAGFSIIRPIITEITPDNGRIGEIININGQYFDTSIAKIFVHFGAVRAQVVSATSTNIKVVVPPSATAGPITVTSQSKSVMSAQHFTLNATNKGYGIQKNSLNAVWIDSTRTTPTYYTKTISHDLDGDGKPEIISIIKDSAIVRVFRNESTNSSLNFKLAYNISTAKNPIDVIIGDLNYDGKPEVVVTYADVTSPNVSVYRNLSSIGSLQFDNRKDYSFDNKADLLPSNLYELALGLGDFNSDGRTDIVVSNGLGNIFSILPNTSNDSTISFGKGIGFNYRSIYNTYGSGSNSVIVADLNQDGKPDLILTNPIKAAVVFLNNTTGNISFKNPINLDGIGPNLASTKNITLVDIDREGKRGIFANHGGTLVYYKNTSTRDTVSFSTYNKLSDRKWLNATVANLSNFRSADILGLKDNMHTDSIPYMVLTNKPTNTGLNYQGQDLRAFPWFVQLVNTTAQDLNGDGKTDILGLNGSQVYALMNRIDMVPTIHSFSPASAGYGDTVQIRGVNFYGVTAVKFKDSAAKSFSIVSDTLITAIVGAGQNGVVTLINNNGMDTLGGFIFKKPEISFTPASGLTFTALQGTATKSQFYLVSAKNLQGPIQVTAPRFFEVSRDPNSGFSQSVNLFSARSTMIGDTVFVRFKTDSSATQFTDSIQHSSIGSAVFKYRVLANICDPVIQFKPFINTVSTDSTLVCFKQDTLTLSVTNGSGYNTYRWSTGDTTATIRITNTKDVTVRVGSRAVCLSEVSPLVRFVKNTNTKPSLAMVGDTSLVSTQAPHYRWYFNNKATNDSSVSIAAKRVGFYRVETSNDKLCWDASNDFAVVVAANSMASDSVAVKIFPNPASGGFFNVVATLERVTSVIARVTVTDANGIVLLQTNKFLFFGKEIKIPVTLSTYKGTAFVRLELNGKVETKTIVLL